MKDHTYVLRPGKWQIAGSTVDVAGNANVAIGYAVVTHEGDHWNIEEQINEVGTHYAIPTVPSEAGAAPFTGSSGIAGPIAGAFAFFADVILATWRSEDGQYVSVESFRMLADDRYETRGALFLKGGYVSSWSYVLERA